MFKPYKLRFPLLLLLPLLLLSCNKKDDGISEEEAYINQNESLPIFIKETYLSEIERIRLHRNQGIADFVSTGLFIKPNQTIEVSRELIRGGNNPQILIGGYSRNLWPDEPELFTVGNTPITITNSSNRDSHIFIRFASIIPTSECKITIKGGYKTPTFTLGQTTNSEFLDMLHNYSYSDMVLRSEKACIVLSKRTALRYQSQDWVNLLETVNEIIDVESYIDGLDSSEPVHTPNRNKYYLTESNDNSYWMAATSYRTFYNSKDAIDFVASVTKLRNDGWGPWHELGHQHQISSLTWSNVIEVTVNIYSLAVERHFGHSSRLQRDGVWTRVADYLNSPIETRDYNNDDELGPFERLAMYQQLWLKYGDDFFIRLHKIAREEANPLYTNQEKMSYFILKASEVTGDNLNDFFREWGFKLPSASFTAVDNLNLPLPSEDLTLLRD